MKYLIAYIATFCIVFYANAQYPDAFLHKIPIEDVVSTDRVNAICQDPSGMIWLGTDNGLISFDGYHMQPMLHNPDDTLSICSNKISTLLADKAGRIWIGTNDKGLSIYDPNNTTWRHLPFLPDDSTGLPASKVYCIAEVDEENIAIGTHAPDILLVNKKTFATTRIRIGDILSYDDRTRLTKSIIVDEQDSNIWWIAGRGGLVKYNKATGAAQSFMYTYKGKKLRSLHNSMNCLYQDGKTIWIGTWGGGMLTFNKQKEEFKSYLYNTEQEGTGVTNCIFTIAPKNDSLFWIGASDKGLGIFNKNTKEYHFYKHDHVDKHSVPAGNVYTLYKDNGDNIWAGGPSGIYLINPNLQVYKTYPLPAGPNEHVQHLHYPIFATPVEGTNNILVGMLYGDGLNVVNRLNKKTSTYIPKLYSKKEGFRPIDCFHYSGNEYLIVTISGICFFNTLTKEWRYINYNKNKELAKGSIRSSYLSGDSVLIIGSFSGSIRRYNLKTGLLQEWNKTNELKDYKVLDRSVFVDIVEDKKGRIVATSFYGLAVIDVVKNKVYSYSPNDGNDYKYYRGLGGLQKDADGYIWVTTPGGGLICLDHEHDYKPLTAITAKGGLANNEISDCTIDSKGRFWISTERTLQCFDNNKKLLLTLRNSKGLPAYYSSWCSTLAYNEELYILWKHNITLVNIKDVLKQTVAKPLKITSATCRDKRLNIHKDISLSHTQNFISIQFSEYDYNYYQDIIFKYRFNDEMDWVENNSRNRIDLIGLAPGSYQLQVLQTSKTYNWQQKNNLLSFTIRPPFYKTWWFLAIIISSIATSIYFLYQYRYRNLKRIEALKTEFNKKVANLEMEALRSQMNPHFIFNSLNSINYYIVKRKPEDASAYLNKFAKLIRSILTFSKDDVIPLSEELNIINLYCELEQMRFQKHFGYSISIEEGLNTNLIDIPPLLLQPYVENAVWHGIMQKEDGGDISINISTIPNGYQFSIKDNGIGRKKSFELKSKTSLKRKSFGTQITGDRVDVFNKLHNGIKLAVDIKDLLNKEDKAIGTEVIISLTHNTYG